MRDDNKRWILLKESRRVLSVLQRREIGDPEFANLKIRARAKRRV